MSAAFTPGPWLIVEKQSGPNGAAICAVGGLRVGTVSNKADKSIDQKWADARLIAAAPDYAVACGADLHPGEAQSCGPLAWLRSAIDTLDETDVRRVAVGEDGDPDAYSTMMTECRLLLEKLEAANAKARGQ